VPNETGKDNIRSIDIALEHESRSSSGDVGNCREEGFEGGGSGC